LDSLEAKDYDVASFLSEQAVQLYKSLLLEELGDYPRTHSISNLLTILGKLEKYKNVAKILEIKKRERSAVTNSSKINRFI
jgi:HEPN domain-containing protein